jgi:hypothetical protein
MCNAKRHVRFTPIADIAPHSITSSARVKPRWNGEAERLGGLEIDDKLDFGRKSHRQVAGFGALQDLSTVSRAMEARVQIDPVANKTNCLDVSWWP